VADVGVGAELEAAGFDRGRWWTGAGAGCRCVGGDELDSELGRVSRLAPKPSGGGSGPAARAVP
jgi:hypothetical protein